MQSREMGGFAMSSARGLARGKANTAPFVSAGVRVINPWEWTR